MMSQEFIKKSLTNIRDHTKLLLAIDDIDHKWSVVCRTCKRIHEDNEDPITPDRIRYYLQTESEAVMMKNVHESNNEGHECEIDHHD